MTETDESKITIKFVTTGSTFNKFMWVDKRQKNGQWAPAFPPPSVEKEEQYIKKMIQRDRESDC